jgi:hypothetical protein
VKAIQCERLRLYAVASSYFPELLLPDSVWSIAVGIDIASVTGEVARQGLLVEGGRLEDFIRKNGCIVEVVSMCGVLLTLLVNNGL